VLSLSRLCGATQRDLKLEQQLAEDSVLEVQLAAAIAEVTKIRSWARFTHTWELLVDFDRFVHQSEAVDADKESLEVNNEIRSQDAKSDEATRVFADVHVSTSKLLYAATITFTWRGKSGYDEKHKVYMLSRWRVILSMSFYVTTAFLDLNAARLFFQGRHYGFAFLTLTVSWFAFFKELPTWMVLREEVRKSLKQGYFSDVLVSLRRTERSIEGFLDMSIAFCGMPWAFAGWSQCVQVCFQILIGMRGVVAQLYVRDQWRRHYTGLAADNKRRSIAAPVHVPDTVAPASRPSSYSLKLRVPDDHDKATVLQYTNARSTHYNDCSFGIELTNMSPEVEPPRSWRGVETPA
jgi:hypothetical protein